MLRFGKEPFLECSSKGEKRFSAFYARVEWNGVIDSIENHYQRAKIFEGGVKYPDWRGAKGKKAINQEEVRKLYSLLWDRYFKKNPELEEVVLKYNGFTDIFGQEGHCCQAEEVYRIRMALGSTEKAAGAFSEGGSYQGSGGDKNG